MIVPRTYIPLSYRIDIRDWLWVLYMAGACASGFIIAMVSDRMGFPRFPGIAVAIVIWVVGYGLVLVYRGVVWLMAII